MEVTFQNIKDSDKIFNHIIVCGIHSSINHFILPLWAQYLGSYSPIVIITDNPIIPEIWDWISRYPGIFIINGSPLYEDVLLKANILNANKAVILGTDMSLNPDEEVNDEMLDAKSIFIYKAIWKCNPHIQILTELVYNTNIDFLVPKRNNLSYQFSTLYAAGEVYISSIIDTLTA